MRNITDIVERVSIHLLIEEKTRNQVFQKINANIIVSFNDDDDTANGNIVVGYINAIRINRSRIPYGYFLASMYQHSPTFMYIGSILYEPHQGMTKLQSLSSSEFKASSILYIDAICIHDGIIEQQYPSSDVGAVALSLFLNHNLMKDITSAVYIIEPPSEGDNVSSRRIVHNNGQFNHKKILWKGSSSSLKFDTPDAYPFIRNGFFRDTAIARQGNTAELILVASPEQWKKNPMGILPNDNPVQDMSHYVSQRQEHPEPTGGDVEIIQTIIDGSEDYKSTTDGDLGSVHGYAIAVRHINTIRNLISSGGSIERSYALHWACAKNCPQLAFSILFFYPNTINIIDKDGFTPLMIAAVNAVCRKRGPDRIDECVVIDILLQQGADRDILDHDNLTAFGHFAQSMKNYALVWNASSLLPSFNDMTHPLDIVIANKLRPTNGPTKDDLAFGETRARGFVHYAN
jgi:Ankyrin repeat